jgi:hypothetical protein
LLFPSEQTHIFRAELYRHFRPTDYLIAITDQTARSPTAADARILGTEASYAPVSPPPDGIQAGFNGDYSGLILKAGAEAHPIWSDTRNLNPFPLNGVAHDEDIFTNRVSLPAGNAKPGTGRVGQD